MKNALVVSKNLSIQADTPRNVVHVEIEALRACSSSGLEKVSSLRLVLLLSSDDPGPWDPRGPVAVEPSPCPSTFQELAEPEPPEADVAFVKILHMRAVRELTFCAMVLTFCCIAANNAISTTRVLTICSTLVILEVTAPTASLMVLTWLSKSANPRASGNNIYRSSIHCASIER